MSAPEEFQLKWSEFQSNVIMSFQSLRQQADFSDVTLVSGDGHQRFEAHKVILASGSDFFKALLSDNSNPHPLIYLRGVKAKQLEILLEYIYQGEVNILEEDLEELFLLATDLQIKGMSKCDEEDKEVKKKSKNKMKNLKSNALKEPIDPKVENFTENDLEKKPLEDVKKSPVVIRFGEKNEMLEQKIVTLFVQKEKGWSCIICGKDMSRRTQIRKHVEIHTEGFVHVCSYCEKEFGTRNGLQLHVYTLHKDKNMLKQDIRDSTISS